MKKILALMAAFAITVGVNAQTPNNATQTSPAKECCKAHKSHCGGEAKAECHTAGAEKQCCAKGGDKKECAKKHDGKKGCCKGKKGAKGQKAAKAQKAACCKDKK